MLSIAVNLIAILSIAQSVIAGDVEPSCLSVNETFKARRDTEMSPIVDVVDIYPLAIGLFFIGTPFESEFLDTVALLDLDWSQVSFYAYYGTDSRLRVSEKSGEMFSNITLLEEAGSSECLARSSFLERAHQSKARYAFMIDSDTFLERPDTVMDLAKWNQTGVVAGFAQREFELYSNFWTDMDSDGWYKRGLSTLDIYNQDKVGLFEVPFARSLLLFRADVLEAMAKLYAANENSMDDCSRLVCIDALSTSGIPFYTDNRYMYGTLLGEDGLVNPDAEFPELYEVVTNPTLWTKRYMVPDYENIELEELCQDVYGAVLFTPRFCQELIATVEGEDNWSAGKHDDERLSSGFEPYPTQDLHMNQFDWEEQWEEILERIMAPMINHYYDGVTYDGGFNIAFVIRYSMGGQRSLDPHNDASLVTTTVLLNDEFTGGGVEYTRYNCTLNPKTPGFFSMHPGQVTHNHKAFPITSGKRYVLVSFND